MFNKTRLVAVEGNLTDVNYYLDSVTFDLDGTLVDMFDDIAAACNLALIEAGFSARTDEEIRRFLGRKSGVLIQRCLNEDRPPVAESVTQLVLARYWHHYLAVTGQNTKVIPGAKECLSEWKRTGLRLAVVTNKPERIAKAVLTRMEMTPMFHAIIAGTTTKALKPSPEPILRACCALNTNPNRNLHIGDSKNDRLAALAAGCEFALAKGVRFTVTPEFVVQSLTL